MKLKNKKFSWENSVDAFEKDRIVTVDMESFKACSDTNNLPYAPNDKQEKIIELVVQEQARTMLYTMDIVLHKFSYVERVGSLKFQDEDQAKQYCFALLYSEPSWRENFTLFGNDMAEAGVVADSFPWINDEFEKLYWNSGQMVSHMLPFDDLQNGTVLDRKIVFDALRAIYERNKALLVWKLNRIMIKHKIRDMR